MNRNSNSNYTLPAIQGGRRLHTHLLAFLRERIKREDFVFLSFHSIDIRVMILLTLIYHTHVTLADMMHFDWLTFFFLLSDHYKKSLKTSTVNRFDFFFNKLTKFLP